MKINTKFTIAIFGFIMSLILATGTTFAWFSMSDMAVVDTIEITAISSAYDLFIALEHSDGSAPDATDYKMRLESEELMNAIGDVQLEDLTPTADMKGLASSNGNAASNIKVASGIGAYVELMFYFKSAKQYDLYFDLDSVLETGAYAGEKMSFVLPGDNGEAVMSAIKWDAGSDTVYQNLFEYYGLMDSVVLNTRSAYAARIGFSSYESVSSVSESEMKIWDPYEKETSIGFYNNEQAYNMAYQFERYIAEKSEITAPVYSAPPAVNDFKADYNNREITSKALVYLQEVESSAANEGGSYYGGKLKVRIWLEGNDGDCFSNIMKDKMVVSLAFRGA